jgi:hypothetical protein
MIIRVMISAASHGAFNLKSRLRLLLWPEYYYAAAAAAAPERRARPGSVDDHQTEAGRSGTRIPD